MSELGKKKWVIPEGYIPPDNPAKPREFISHETACILNVNESTAHVSLMLFFDDRDPVGPYLIEVPPQRTLHLRFNQLKDPDLVPKGTDFSSVISSDIPIVVQFTRLDSRKDGLALLSTIAYSE